MTPADGGLSNAGTRPSGRVLRFATPGEAPGLVGFLTRQLRWDKSAVVRLRGDGDVLAAFTRPARFDVLAVRSGQLSGADTAAGDPGGLGAELDRTVSAGQLLDAIDEPGQRLTLPPAVTGPPWAGLLPPRGDWRRLAEPAMSELRASATAVIAEFRARTERLAPAERTRSAVDALADEVWNRQYPGTRLPLRAVHAAYALGFLRDDSPPVLLGSDGWLRLRTGLGSVAVRGGGLRPALSLTPL